MNVQTDVNLTIVSEKDVNPDIAGVASPVVLRVYQLSNAISFQKANFIDIYMADEKAMAGEILGMQKVGPFSPDTTSSIKLKVSNETKCLGVFVEYSKYENSTYKLIIPIVQHNISKNSFNILLKGNTVLTTD